MNPLATEGMIPENYLLDRLKCQYEVPELKCNYKSIRLPIEKRAFSFEFSMCYHKGTLPKFATL